MSVELDATVTDDRKGGPAGPALGPGTMLAHFRIEALLGKGGMGEVYRATDVALDRPVALKVLPASVGEDASRRERLFREARAQARLQHPNVCHVYYVGQEAGVVFFAMELVPGETLAERVARGPLPAGEAVELIRQAALGLREAWRLGFTHRDVKPSNLMLDREGRVKVVDFGLVSREAGGDASAAMDATGIVGTPLYMAPEQGRTTEAASPRADIYALGVTLHHLLSGRPPFHGESLDVLATQHREAPRPKLATGGKRGRALSAIDQIVNRMMAKRPEDRHASYDELIADLERVSVSRTRPAGAVVRSLAFLIDLLLLTMVLSPVFVIADESTYDLDENAMVLAVGFVYYVVGLSRFGTTVGRALLDLEVIAVAGQGRPTPFQALVRFAVELGPLTAAIAVRLARQATGQQLLEILEPMLAIGGFVYGMVSLVAAAVRTPDKRTWWDRAAGTMVRYRRR